MVAQHLPHERSWKVKLRLDPFRQHLRPPYDFAALRNEHQPSSVSRIVIELRGVHHPDRLQAVPYAAGMAPPHDFIGNEMASPRDTVPYSIDVALGIVQRNKYQMNRIPLDFRSSDPILPIPAGKCRLDRKTRSTVEILLNPLEYFSSAARAAEAGSVGLSARATASGSSRRSRPSNAPH